MAREPADPPCWRGLLPGVTPTAGTRSCPPQGALGRPSAALSGTFLPTCHQPSSDLFTVTSLPGNPLLLSSTPCPLLSFITSQQQLKARPTAGGLVMSSGPGSHTVEGLDEPMERGASAEGAAPRLWQRPGNPEGSGQAGTQQRSHQGHLEGPLSTGTSGPALPRKAIPGRPVHAGPPHRLGQSGPGCAPYLAIGCLLTVQVVSQVPAVTVLQKTSHTSHLAARADPPSLPRPPRHPTPDPWALRHPPPSRGRCPLQSVFGEANGGTCHPQAPAEPTDT